MPGAARPVDWTTATSWTFEPLDDDAFPAVRLARRAGTHAGTAPAVFNAANEICVDAFHDGALGFVDILDIVEQVLAEHLSDGRGSSPGVAEPTTDVRSIWRSDDELTVETVLAADAWARERARELTKRT